MLQLLRMVGILLGMLMAAGFGLCGAVGVAAAGRAALVGDFDPGGFGIILVCGLAGLGIGWVCARAAWAATKSKPDAGGPPAP